jgi:DNA ligase D-like protein (predicted 3'-phosphoesterase)
MAIFVVQKHQASHLHWDFRIELDGVLKSWAVPKEPPIETGVKRLAVAVDDHDLSYADFEGEIPEGQYGAGSVKIWDRGKYEMISRHKEKMVIALHGKKMKGEYVLLRFKKTGEKNWLLFKKEHQ